MWSARTFLSKQLTNNEVEPNEGFNNKMSNMEWQESANCATVDPETFFPERGGSNRMAKYICSRCIVRPECLEHALDLKNSHDEFGVVAGLTPRERAVLRKKKK